jgi:poly(A) polymerase
MSLKTYNYLNLVKNFPFEVREIFKIFLKEGDEIRLVGGCVRDLLINKEVNDFDFATKFLPQEVIKILEKNHIKAVPTGVKFGTITAVINHKNFEITTLRKDFETDGRHCNPEFIDDYFFDAARRDFTMNALYLDDKGVVYDYFDGVEDIKKQYVKFIGNAQERIKEDYLRILRFFRFSCNYAKNLDEIGFAACVLEKKGLKKLSRERIRIEFLKLISSKNHINLIKILQQIEDQKIAEEIFATAFDIKALTRIFEIINELKIEVNLELKIAILFLNLFSESSDFCEKNSTCNNKEKSDNFLQFFKEICATNSEKKYFQFLNSNFTKISYDETLKTLKILLAFNDKKLVKDLYLLAATKNIDIKITTENLNFISDFSLPNFPFDGNYLKKLGFREKEIGIILNKAKISWAENDFNPNPLLEYFIIPN